MKDQILANIAHPAQNVKLTAQSVESLCRWGAGTLFGLWRTWVMF